MLKQEEEKRNIYIFRKLKVTAKQITQSLSALSGGGKSSLKGHY
jgi:hypothetical protein